MMGGETLTGDVTTDSMGKWGRATGDREKDNSGRVEPELILHTGGSENLLVLHLYL